jgi:hypothetical protein
LSEINPEELETRIKKWIIKSRTVNIRIIKEEKSHFALSFKNAQTPLSYPSIQIRYLKMDPDVLTISWKLTFTNSEVTTLNKINNKTKTELQNKIREGFLLMNLSLNIVSSQQNIKEIACIKRVYLDGLSEDRFTDITDKIIRAYEFTLRKLDEYLKFPKPFDPDDLT